MPTYAELQLQIAELERQAQAIRRSEISAVIADIKTKMTEYGITLTDLGGRSVGSLSRPKGSVAAKYRNPVTGETWSGRGKHPKWLAAQIASGKDKASFLLG